MTSRKTQPENVTYLWDAIVNSTTQDGGASNLKILKYLQKNEYKSAQVEELIKNAVDDGIIIKYIVKINGRSFKYYRIPNLNEIKINENEKDYYCYECHIPSDDLKQCSKCLRVFHQKCYRIDPDIPNNARSVVVNKQHVKKSFKYDDDDDDKLLNNSNSENIQDNLLTRKPRGRKRKNTENLNNKSNDIEEDDDDDDDDDEERQLVIDINMDVDNEQIPDDNSKNRIKFIKDEDCSWVKNVRSPSRRLTRTISVKYEIDDNEENMEQMLCSHCRIICKKFRDPPNMTVNDVNYLLRFVFDRIKTWTSFDIFSPSTNSSSKCALSDKKYLKIYKKLFFKYPKSLLEIDRKIKNKAYTSITEFQSDFMDIQHCIGIIYGCESLEYGSVIYQVRDCVYELGEIRICPDCYTNSNQRTENWFCRPCVTRHELVYAKHGKFSYWPAKVLRLTKNQYDVRFFGPKHPRALINCLNIKPIDADLDELKVKYTVPFKKAIHELREHQKLLQLPFEQLQIIETTSNVDFQQQQKQPKQSLNNHITDSDGSIDLTTITIEPVSLQSPKGSNKRKRRQSSAFTNNCLTMDDQFNDVTNKKSKVSVAANRSTRIKSLLTTLGIREFNYSKSALPSSSATMNAADATVASATTIASAAAASTTSTARPSSSNSMLTLNNKGITSTMMEQYRRRASVYYQEPVSSTEDSTNNASVGNFIENVSKSKKQNETKNIAIELFKKEHNVWQTKLEQLKDHYENEIREIKKQAWCYYCQKPAMYYCCWSTNYCSTECQQKHWKSEHKGNCKRKR